METLFFEVTLAVIPCIAVALFIYLRDKYNPEPFRLVIFSFLLGILAFGLNLIVGWYPHHFFQSQEQSLWDKALHTFAAIALPEELCKFLVLRLLIFRNRSGFSEPIDGIVYAVMVGMGFACIENLVYVIKYGAGSGILRMFSAIPAHAMLGVIMGFHLGIAKFTRKKKFKFNMLALAIPVVMHGMYNLFLFLHYIPGMWIGAGIGMLISLYFCFESIRLHRRFSPFNPKNPRNKHLHKKPLLLFGDRAKKDS
jgi:RsiW-degrading membrane proteinase PrsW (M82 family)